MSDADRPEAALQSRRSALLVCDSTAIIVLYQNRYGGWQLLKSGPLFCPGRFVGWTNPVGIDNIPTDPSRAIPSGSSSAKSKRTAWMSITAARASNTTRTGSADVCRKPHRVRSPTPGMSHRSPNRHQRRTATVDTEERLLMEPTPNFFRYIFSVFGKGT